MNYLIAKKKHFGELGKKLNKNVKKKLITNYSEGQSKNTVCAALC